MKLLIREVISRTQLREFIYLPGKIYASYPNWVPPLYADEWHFHSPKHNSALSYSDVTRVIAYQDGIAVGRIMGIINKRYNDRLEEKTGRFFNLDCGDSDEIATSLVQYVEGWARARGMDRLIGPYGFSDKDPQGMQIAGFDHLPVIAAPTNPPYMQKLLERQGYEPALDCVSYQLPVPEETPPLFKKIFKRLVHQANFHLVEFRTRNQLKPFIVPVFALVNEAYSPLFGFVPMSEEEINKFAAQYLPILDPAFVKVVVGRNGDPVAFVVAMPDMSRGMQKAKGKLFPFGFLYVLQAMKKSKQLNLLLGAVKPGYRGKGITAMLATSLFKTASKRGMKVIDSHLILESNHLMRAECENADGILYKRFRVYQKIL